MDLRLDLRVPGAGHIRTVWTPAAGGPRGWAWLQHGFARTSAGLAGLASGLAAQGICVVRPDLRSLTPRRSMHDRAYLTAVTLTLAAAVDEGTVAARGVPVSGPWLGVGHSAGAAVVVHAAAVLASRPVDIAGLILLDPVDTVGGLLAGSLPEIPGIPIVAFACPPSRCNRQGRAALQLRARADVVDLPLLSHADPERIPGDLRASSVPPAGRVVTAMCGRGGSPPAVIDLGERVVDTACTLVTL